MTVWSEVAVAVTVPVAAIRRKPESSATSQVTVTSGPRPEPGVASGADVTRVHSRTPSGNGSPEATPWRKTGRSPSAARSGETPSSVAVAAAEVTRVRRDMGRFTGDYLNALVMPG
ncbi:hypothetical protein GCM10020221_01730 [Streptomyces thioluteus]|uniref:Uncharacterized protein n=1 Tax=Streptomyces thioluteus TaxID=66431 RepID=A0ABN3WAN4_STRTU